MNLQLDLLAQFDGSTFQPERDGERLRSQLQRVRDLMIDGQWRTLQQIAHHVGGSEAGVSARLRDLRKPRNGAYTVNRRHVEDGLHEYQVVKPW
jgi:hypothetical protein